MDLTDTFVSGFVSGGLDSFQSFCLTFCFKISPTANDNKFLLLAFGGSTRRTFDLSFTGSGRLETVLANFRTQMDAYWSILVTD